MYLCGQFRKLSSGRLYLLSFLPSCRLLLFQQVSFYRSLLCQNLQESRYNQLSQRVSGGVCVACVADFIRCARPVDESQSYVCVMP